MSEWKEYRLDEVADVVDCEHKTAPIVENSEYYSIRTSNILNGKIDFYGSNRVSFQTYQEWTKRAAPKEGDIILAREAPVGEVGMVKKGYKVCLGQRTVLLGVKNDDVDTYYLLYYLANPAIKFELISRSTGSVVAHLNMKDIRAFKVQIPQIRVQRAIASVLSSLDDKIDLLHHQNKTLEAMAETLFRQWFVEGADEGWGEGDIYSLIDVVYGFPFKSKFFNEDKRGLPLIRIRNLENGYSKIYTDEVCENKHKIRCGDLLAGMDGEFRIYLWAGETAVLNQRACKFVPKFDFVPHLYIYGMMKPHLHYYENVNVGTTVVHLGKSDLDDIKIPIPPKDVLIKFGEIVNPLFEKFKINYNQIRTLEKLRDTLLPKLMSGEVRVKLEQQEAGI